VRDADQWPVAAHFLTAEYVQFAEDFRANEESGERRVSLFFGVATATGVALGIAADRDSFDDDTLRMAAAVALGGLLLVGIATLLRIVKRNVVSDQYKTAMDSIRAVFRAQSASLLVDYNPFVGRRDYKYGPRSPRPVYGFLPLGLVLLISAVNATITVGLVLAVSQVDLSSARALPIAAATYGAAIVTQLLLADMIEAKLRGDAPHWFAAARGAVSLGRGDRGPDGGQRTRRQDDYRPRTNR